MNKILTTIIIIGAMLFGGWYFLASTPTEEPEKNEAASSPLGATYLIGGESFTLVDGSAEKESTPGSATKNKVSVFGEPVYGDVDIDGDDDAVLILVNDPGGSGTFYYAAMAMRTDQGFLGTNVLLLGDRIAPQTVEIRNGIAIANYADRAPGEPMTARPSIGKSAYMTLEKGELKEAAPLSEGEQVLFGYLTIGHEARSFRPCGEGQREYWLSGDSPALDTLKETYANEVSDVPPAAYAPLFAVVAGKIIDAPQDGFGADYEYALRVSQLIRADRKGSCKSDLIVVASPLAGSIISSPLIVEGFARGTWYFEASFPLILTDWDGRIIAEGYATAQSDWMTEAFVPFKGTLEFKKPESLNGFSNRGALIFKKDNPSGLPEHDDALEITVYFE